MRPKKISGKATKAAKPRGPRPAAPVVPGRKRRGRIVLPEGPDQLRLFFYLFFNFIQRLDKARREAYAGDIELATISEAIALAAIEPLMRDPGFREQFRSIEKVVGVAPQRGVNALSVAFATGIPRETTRRKVKKLIALGAISQVGPGEYIMRPGFLQQPSLQEPFAQLMADTVRFINDSLDLGLFEWSAK
jgi:hypothetical protein